MQSSMQLSMQSSMQSIEQNNHINAPVFSLAPTFEELMHVVRIRIITNLYNYIKLKLKPEFSHQNDSLDINDSKISYDRVLIKPTLANSTMHIIISAFSCHTDDFINIVYNIEIKKLNRIINLIEDNIIYIQGLLNRINYLSIIREYIHIL